MEGQEPTGSIQEIIAKLESDLAELKVAAAKEETPEGEKEEPNPEEPPAPPPSGGRGGFLKKSLGL